MNYAAMRSFFSAGLLCRDHIKWSFLVRAESGALSFRHDATILERSLLMRLLHPDLRWPCGIYWREEP